MQSRYLIPLTCLALAACGGGGGSSNNASTSDPCGNDIGNGNVIISGPAAADGVLDFDQPFRSLIVHPLDSQTLYVGTERNGILRSRDGGITWQRLRAGLRHMGGGYPEVYDLAISASNPDVLYAATVNSPGPTSGDFPSSIAGLYKSVDGGDTWVRKNCGLTSAAVNSVYVSATDSNVVVAGVGGGMPSFTGLSGYFDGGIFTSSDGGDSWARVNLASNDNRASYPQLVPRPGTPASIFTFGLAPDPMENIGLFRSEDTGASWNAVATPFTNRRIVHFGVGASGNRLVLNEQDSFELQISENAGASWTASTVVGANGPVRISPHNRDHILVADNNDLWFSDDALVSAQKVVDGAIDFFMDIEFAISDANVVYAVTRQYHLYKSADGGVSFAFVEDLRTNVINAIP